jgi:outer membrane protein assembly factor BamB
MSQSNISRRKILSTAALSGTSGVTLFTTNNVEAASTTQEESSWPMQGANPKGTSRVPSDQAPSSDAIEKNWSTDIPNGEAVTPVVNNNRVIAGIKRPNLMLTSINLETGKKQWNHTAEDYTHSSLVFEKRSIILPADGKLERRSPKGGQRKDSKEIPNSPGTLFDCISTSNHIVFSDMAGVGARKRGESNIEWKYAVKSRHTPQKVVSDSNTVYLATKGVSEDGCQRQGKVHSLRLSNGSRDWTFSMPTDIRELAISETVILVGAVGQLCAISPETGSKIWQKSTKTGSPGLAIKGDSLIFGGYGSVSKIDITTGKIIWEQKFNSDYINPAIAGDTVFVAGSGRNRAKWEAKIEYFDIESGQKKASHHLNESRIHGPALANDTLFITADSGTAYAFTGGD